MCFLKIRFHSFRAGAAIDEDIRVATSGGASGRPLVENRYCGGDRR
jgi:hypothetical protein